MHWRRKNVRNLPVWKSSNGWNKNSIYQKSAGWIFTIHPADFIWRMIKISIAILVNNTFKRIAIFYLTIQKDIYQSNTSHLAGICLLIIILWCQIQKFTPDLILWGSKSFPCLLWWLRTWGTWNGRVSGLRFQESDKDWPYERISFLQPCAWWYSSERSEDGRDCGT